MNQFRGGRSGWATLRLALPILILACGAAKTRAATLAVDAAKVERTMDRTRLLGSNVAGWFPPEVYDDPAIRGWVRELGPILLRLPGGSWGDGTFWNGNGVRHGNDVDYTKLDPHPFSPSSAAWGTWTIDYSAYAPGFLVDVKPNEKPKMLSTQWHGNVDVKTMHEYVRAVGGKPFVIVNGGTGSPRDAAEWVRWANVKMGYDVRYWEVGNELGGSWEAGHFLPDGKELNGEIYARRYEEFARAMKAVDPTIKVGCMDWLEDVLRRCGDLVDFVSIHTYPVQGRESDDELFAKLGEVRKDMERTRALLARVAPARAGKIEIDYSEWNMGWPDNRGALWHAGWVGEMYRWGTDFAMQWQAFDILTHDTPSVRRSLYWSFWIWSRYMGDQMVASKLVGNPRLAAYATRTGDGLAIMVINQSGDDEAKVDFKLAGFTPAAEGRVATFSRREFFWLDRDPELPGWKKRPWPFWNTGPTVRPLKTSRSLSATLPPASITVFMIPAKGGTPAVAPTVPPSATTLDLQMHLPAEAYANDTVEGWVYARNGSEEAPYPGPLADGRLGVAGVARANRSTVRLADAAGRFTLRADGPGSATVTVTAGGANAVGLIRFKSSVPQPRVLWEFEEEAPPPTMHSHWKLTFDDSIRANQKVARVNVGGETPQGDEKRALLIIDPIAKGDTVDRKNIRGAFCDLRTAGDFRCADPDASVTLVMQSPMNWWMPLGSVKLSECADWKTVTFQTDDPQQTKAMPEAFNLWFILKSARPVEGSILIDRAGLMIR